MRVPQRPPAFDRLLNEVASQPERFQKLVTSVRGPCVGDRYRHWEKLRRLPSPEGLTHEEWWLGLKLARLPLRRSLPLRDVDGVTFSYTMPDPLQELLLHVDRDASGRIELPSPVATPEVRDRYVISSLIEEAVTSSQLEGASTTRRVARQMIRSGRKPRDRSEQMIWNNYVAMQHMRSHVGKPLDVDWILDLHRRVTVGTLDNPAAAGCFRTDDDVHVVNHYDEVIHRPPAFVELPERVQAMCAFANGETPTGFVHPVIRAVVLHFWLAYDHPFEDGNGRTARALFYWSMLSQKYWLSEFISISPLLTQAPARYGRAFLYSETDDNDLTYFLLYHLDLLCRAIGQLHEYLGRKAQEQQEAERHMRTAGLLNHRQLALVSHALRHPGFQYTFESHRTSHGVVYQTARADLLGLVEKGLLEAGKRGRIWVFTVPADLGERLSALG